MRLPRDLSPNLRPPNPIPKIFKANQILNLWSSNRIFYTSNRINKDD